MQSLQIDSPIFAFTTDLDWASEYCIQDLKKILDSFGISPTVFVTHQSSTVQTWKNAEVGIHPNFNLGSTHGQNINSVLDHVLRIAPDAKCFRSHSFYDCTAVAMEMRNRGIIYDSNLCLYLQPNLHPLNHIFGSMRFPVFFEDDVQWYYPPNDWNVSLEPFLTPGLKVLNFHPFMVALNIPSLEYYNKIKNYIAIADFQTITEHRYQGNGPRTFLLKLLTLLTNKNNKFYKLQDLHQMFYTI
jgi:hypothetical protein